MTPPIEETVATTAGGAVTRGFGQYSAYMAPLWTVSHVADQSGPFEAVSRVHEVGRAVLGHTRAPAHVSERTGVHAARMGVDHLLVVARNSGRADLDLGFDECRSVGNEVTILDLSRPFRAVVTHVDVVTLALPRALIAPFVRDADDLHGTVLRREDPFGSLAWSHLNGLARESDRMREDETGALIEATAALIAACADRVAPSANDVRMRARPAVLIAIRRALEERLADQHLGALWIAKRFGLSRSTVYRLFEPFGGVERYILRRRLARAFQMLCRTSRTQGDYVYQVGTACGFRSDSAFSHAFRREYGRTPRDVLLSAASAAAPSDDLEIGRWLRDLA